MRNLRAIPPVKAALFAPGSHSLRRGVAVDRYQDHPGAPIATFVGSVFLHVAAATDHGEGEALDVHELDTQTQFHQPIVASGRRFRRRTGTLCEFALALRGSLLLCSQARRLSCKARIARKVAQGSWSVIDGTHGIAHARENHRCVLGPTTRDSGYAWHEHGGQVDRAPDPLLGCPGFDLAGNGNPGGARGDSAPCEPSHHEVRI